MISEIHRKGYRPPPTKRVYIPKPGKANKRRPIAMPTIKDKALQRATAEVLNAIYEQDFLEVSYGGRPKRSAHQAIAQVRANLMVKPINFVYESDLKNFFGSLDHGRVEQFLRERVGDPRLLTLIRRWLKAGVMEGTTWVQPETGAAQGGPISVLISNIYLHYVLDLWIEKVVKPRMKGEIFYVRYLDDFVLGFEYHSDAVAFERVLTKRLAKFQLELEPTKTRLIRFGRQAKSWHQHHKAGKPETFCFLGFTFYCDKTRKGRFKVGMKTEKNRLKRSCAKITEQLKRNRHLPIRLQAKQINQVLRGHYQYYGVSGNWDSIKRYYYHVIRNWRKWLSSRSQTGKLSWIKYRKLLTLFPLQAPKIAVNYTRLQQLALL